MKGFCISLDVSKGSSFYQGFKGLDEPITKPKKIEHNLEGFKELLKLKDSIRKEYDSDCIVIFESTGVYHKALQTYLDEHDFKYTIISPLLSAKVRKSDIRGTKTDAKDCASIAKVFYLKELRIYSKTDEIYDDLKEKSRYYDFLVDEMKRWKVEFRRLLDIIYPGFDKIFENLYIDYTQALLLEYPHPEIIRKKRLPHSCGTGLLRSLWIRVSLSSWISGRPRLSIVRGMPRGMSTEVRDVMGHFSRPGAGCPSLSAGCGQRPPAAACRPRARRDACPLFPPGRLPPGRPARDGAAPLWGFRPAVPWADRGFPRRCARGKAGPAGACSRIPRGPGPFLPRHPRRFFRPPGWSRSPVSGGG